MAVRTELFGGSAVEAATVRRLGGVIVRADNGTEPDPEKPLDVLQSTVQVDCTLDTTGKKKARRAATDRMLSDLQNP